MTGIEVTYVDANTFTIDGNLTDIFKTGKNIKADCGADGFKFGKVVSSSWASNITTVILTTESDDLTINLTQVWYEDQPRMEDGRPIVRADTRPIDTETYFTMTGDGVGIGDGKHLEWDFSNDDDLYVGPEVHSGMKCKKIELVFHCPVYLKDGTIYFFNALWGSYLEMDVIVPSGAYYPNPAGPIPASALGLSGNQMYAQANGDVVYQRYVNKHHMKGDCPMGDELNAEGAAVSAVPPGWKVRGLIIVPENDTASQGYGSLEMYRCHTVLLPGQTLETLH